MKSFVGTTQNSKGEVLRHFLYRAFAANQSLTILGGIMLATFVATLVSECNRRPLFALSSLAFRAAQPDG